MPLYAYQCKSCGHSFEEVLKISDRNLPVDNPCTECNNVGIEIVIHSPRIVSGVGDARKQVPTQFKERLAQIKSQSGRGCTIET